MNKYAELQYQLQGLKNAIAKMEYGINENDSHYIQSEMKYFKEKSERVLSEAEYIINQSE